MSIMRTKFEEGMEKGIEKGKEEGRREEKITIAKTLLLQGVNIETIATATALSQEEISKLL